MNPGDVMLLGALKLELDPAGEVVGARNAVMTVHSDGSLGPRYDKAHLVPYGEYLPMRPILSAIGLSRLAPGDIDFWPGPGPARSTSAPSAARGCKFATRSSFRARSSTATIAPISSSTRRPTPVPAAGARPTLWPRSASARSRQDCPRSTRPLPVPAQ